MDVVAWLMDGDPAIRWQCLRDLLDAPEARWRTEQALVASEGWGARLLSYQDSEGRWTPKLYGRKWISTTYSMALLRRMGLPGSDARARSSARLFLDQALRVDGGIVVTRAPTTSETCVTGMVLGILSWFSVDDPRRARLVDYLLAEQMPDGGWNCERHAGATHSSFHTTINVLEGLAEYVAAGGGSRSVATAAADGRRFLAAHRLYRSHRTGAVVDARMTRLSFPPRWRHDILRGLDHFAATDAARDPRLDDPIDVLERKRSPEGRWPLQQRHPGATWFEMEAVGEPSRWNTLRALRVLRWWYRTQPSGDTEPG